MNSLLSLALVLLGAANTGAFEQIGNLSSTFRTGADAMAVVAVTAKDSCQATGAARVTAAAIWVDGRYGHELLLLPGSGRETYDSLVGPLTAGQHTVELRPSEYWKAVPCLRAEGMAVAGVEPSEPRHTLLRYAPVLELRADTVGEQTDVPLFEYVESDLQAAALRLRYTVVFTNEDGGTQTRALFARWGRTTDIEQVYEAWLREGRVAREEFQGPDHEVRAFKGRRLGAAPVLLVATMNNMVTDRGRGIAAVRPVPDPVDLAGATRESTLDSRPWAYRAMQAEMAAEGRIAAGAPQDDHWMRVAPDPRDHVYFEAKLTLDHAVAAAWVQDASGRRYWSHYELESLALDRNGWVRTAVAVGPNPGSKVVQAGWACIKPAKEMVTGTCAIDATRAFAFGDNWAPGANLVAPARLELHAGEEAVIKGREDSPEPHRPL